MQEFKSKYSEGIQISDISHLDSEELEVIVKVQILYISIHFKPIVMIVEETPNLPEDLLHKLILTGYCVALYLAQSDEEYTMFYDYAFDLITIGKEKSCDVNFQYVIQTEGIQTLAFFVRQAFNEKKLKDSEFNSLKMVNKLMELAQMVPITAFGLENITYKLQELYPKMNNEGDISEAIDLMDEFKLIREEPENPHYLSTKIGVYT